MRFRAGSKTEIHERVGWVGGGVRGGEVGWVRGGVLGGGGGEVERALDGAGGLPAVVYDTRLSTVQFAS